MLEKCFTRVENLPGVGCHWHPPNPEPGHVRRLEQADGIYRGFIFRRADPENPERVQFAGIFIPADEAWNSSQWVKQSFRTEAAAMAFVESMLRTERALYPGKHPTIRDFERIH